MIRQIPNKQSRRWEGAYLGSYYGDIWKTFNVDLDREEGKISLSRRTLMVADTTDTNSDTLGRVSCFLISDASDSLQYWAASRGGRLYRASVPNDSWDLDTLANSPTGVLDMTIHENDSDSASGQNVMFVTNDTDIATLNDTGANTWNANWWVTTKSQPALKTGSPHPIEYFALRRITLIGDGNKVHTIDKNKDISNGRLILPVYLRVEHIFTTAYRAWILCSSQLSGNGAIIEWDGSSETFNAMHNLQSQYPISGVNWNEYPIVLNHKGVILEYTGNGFEQMVRNGQKISFPVSEEDAVFSPASDPATLPGRCMTVGTDGLVYFHLAEGVGTSTNRSIRGLAGIWCLNVQTGRLYNKNSLVDNSNNYGFQSISSNGAIFRLSPESYGVSFLMGGSYYPTLAGTKYGIWLISSSFSATNRGYFITQLIPANEIKEFWQFIWLRFKSFISATDKIIVKAKGVNSLTLQDMNPLDLSCTWVDATSFTATLAAADDALQVGDEVEVLYGDNAGTLSHITVITGAHGALQTFTIDETVTASTNTFVARFDRWKKLGEVSTQNIYEQKFNIGIDSSFIQFKIELRGIVKQLQVSNILINSDNSIELK
jgi:hypothetical protein